MLNALEKILILFRLFLMIIKSIYFLIMSVFLFRHPDDGTIIEVDNDGNQDDIAFMFECMRCNGFVWLAEE